MDLSMKGDLVKYGIYAGWALFAIGLSFAIYNATPESIGFGVIICAVSGGITIAFQIRRRRNY